MTCIAGCALMEGCMHDMHCRVRTSGGLRVNVSRFTSQRINKRAVAATARLSNISFIEVVNKQMVNSHRIKFSMQVNVLGRFFICSN